MKSNKRVLPVIYLIIILCNLFLIINCGGGGGGGKSANPLDNWHAMISIRDPNDAFLSQVNFLNGTFIVLGRNGSILISSDGINWTSRKSGVTSSLNWATYGNGTFVIVGDSGIILTSSDDIKWSSRKSRVSYSLKWVAYGNGTFVIVGDSGTILTSNDGVNWTVRTSGVYPNLAGVTYGNSTFVAVGEGGTILTSSDGINWTTRSSTGTTYLRGISYGNETFLIAGDGGYIFTSKDAVTWTSRRIIEDSFASLYSVIYANGNFYITISTDRGNNTYIFSSPDGINWSSKFVPINISLTYGNGIFVAVNTSTILSTADLSTWAVRSLSYYLEDNIGIGNIAFGNNTFVAPSGLGNLISTDGVNWITNFDLTNSIQVIDFYNGKFVGLGGDYPEGGRFHTSSDGMNWTSIHIDAQPFQSAYGNGKYVILCRANRILSSPDGINWTSTDLTYPELKGIAYGNGVFIIVGVNGTIITSSDGVNWTLRSSGTNAALYAVTYGNGTFLIFGDNSTTNTLTLTSTDSINWAQKSLEFSRIYFDWITFGNSTFIAVGSGGKIISSPDALNWKSRNSGFYDELYKVIDAKGTFVAIGINKILQSDTI